MIQPDYESVGEGLKVKRYVLTRGQCHMKTANYHVTTVHSQMIPMQYT